MIKASRSFVLAIVFCVMLTAFLAGCSKKSGTEAVPTPSAEATVAPDATTEATPAPEESKGIVSDPNKKVKLRYFVEPYYDGVEFDVAYPEWQKLHPNIEVELVKISSEFDASVKMAMVSGEQVDVIYTGTNLIDRAVPDSLYLPLDDLIKKDGWDLDQEFGEYKDHLIINGKQYGLPRAVTPNGIWYNKRIFEEAGIADPSSGDWTWDEYFQIAKKLSKYDKAGKNERYGVQIAIFSDGQLADVVQNIALYAGWEMLKPDGSFNTDWAPFKKAAELLYNAIYVDKSMPSIADVKAGNLSWINEYYAGRNAMAIGGRTAAIFVDYAREYGQISIEDDDAGIHSLAPMPRWDANSPKKQADEVVTAVAMSKSTEHPEEAYLFMKWLSTDAISLSSKMAHRMPASKNLDKTALLENWRTYDNADGKLVQGPKRDDLYSRMMDPEIKPIFKKVSLQYSYSGKMRAELEKQLSLLFANELTVDEAVEKAKVAAFKIYYDETQK